MNLRAQRGRGERRKPLWNTAAMVILRSLADLRVTFLDDSGAAKPRAADDLF